MLSRPALAAFASALFLASCDAGITDPPYEHFSSVSLTGGFACGLDAEGAAWCWGSSNYAGQLGNGTNDPSLTPVRVKTSARFQQLGTGSAHACGLTTGGRVLCWGDNSQAQIGAPTTDLACELKQSNGWIVDHGNECALVPAEVETDLRFVQIAVADHRTCARTDGGALWCWGSGVLGDSAVTGVSAVPVRVGIPGSIQNFALGPYHGCASDGDGIGWCWGYNNNGALGRGTTDSLTSWGPIPEPINSTAYLRKWALGRAHSCALTSSGSAICWGQGDRGQRGDSTTGNARNDPTFVATSRVFTQIASAADATCALEAGTGAAWCWGANSGGRLGDGTVLDRLAPAPVLGGLRFTRLQMGSTGGYGATTTACGSTRDGIYCWGPLPEPLTFEE